MLAGDRERVARTFVVPWNVQLEAAHHFITMQWSLNVLKMQQQPQLKTGHGSNGLKGHWLLGIVSELAIERGSQRQSLVIAFMIITVKHCIDLADSKVKCNTLGFNE